MKRKRLAVILGVIAGLQFYGGVFAQEGILVAARDSQMSLSKGQKCFLWKVQSQRNTVYILGSIHVAKESLYPLNEKIERAFNNSEVLAVEVNIDDANVIDNQVAIMKKAVYADNGTLKKNLSPQTYQLLKIKLSQFSLPIEVMQQYKPWYLAVMLQSLELQKLGYNPNYGIDLHFLQKAQGVKNILELESWDYQISLFDTFSNYEQELFLDYTLRYLDKLEETVDEILELWLKGDVKTLETVLLEQGMEEQKLAPLFEKLFYERNRKMTVRIEEFLKTYKDYFVIVGAGHLVGNRGIIELLKKKGYSVEQL